MRYQPQPSPPLVIIMQRRSDGIWQMNKRLYPSPAFVTVQEASDYYFSRVVFVTADGRETPVEPGRVYVVDEISEPLTPQQWNALRAKKEP